MLQVKNSLLLKITAVALAIMGLVTNAWSMDRIITFGDSITSGVKQDAARTVIFCGANGGSFTPPYVCNGNGAVNVGGYQPFVRSRLLNQGVSVTLYNWGFAGKESDQLLGDIQPVMAARASEYVFIMVGINDVNEGNYSTATTVFNVSRIIDRVLDADRIPILGTVTPWTENSTFLSRVQQINAGIKAYAEEQRVDIADHYAALIGNFANLHSGDKIHLRTAGNSIVANQWIAAYFASLEPDNGFVPAVNFLLLD